MPGRREQQSYEKKIRKAKAKSNADLAQRLATRRPTYTLDRLVKERQATALPVRQASCGLMCDRATKRHVPHRYPAFVDALRDMDDPLSMIHLFAVLPAEQAYNIPAHQVCAARPASYQHAETAWGRFARQFFDAGGLRSDGASALASGTG